VRRLLVLVPALLLLALAAGADVFVLTNGDRITGKRLRSGKRTVVVQTDFGRLTIPRAQVQKIVKADGTEEYVSEGAPLPSAKLSLIVIGQSFWQAWEPKSHPRVDPSLRLEVRVDGEVVATYTDSRPDPRDLPGATVNTFSFLAGDVEAEGAPGVTVATPEVKLGRATLRLEIPQAADAPPRHVLRVTYQVNTGSAGEGLWKDLVSVDGDVALSRAATVGVQLKQGPGRMAFAGRKGMTDVDTFVMALGPVQ
jgi:hypothetical protein